MSVRGSFALHYMPFSNQIVLSQCPQITSGDLVGCRTAYVCFTLAWVHTLIELGMESKGVAAGPSVSLTGKPVSAVTVASSAHIDIALSHTHCWQQRRLRVLLRVWLSWCIVMTMPIECCPLQTRHPVAGACDDTKTMRSLYLL